MTGMSMTVIIEPTTQWGAGNDPAERELRRSDPQPDLDNASGGIIHRENLDPSQDEGFFMHQDQ